MGLDILRKLLDSGYGCKIVVNPATGNHKSTTSISFGYGRDGNLIDITVQGSGEVVFIECAEKALELLNEEIKKGNK